MVEKIFSLKSCRIISLSLVLLWKLNNQNKYKPYMLKYVKCLFSPYELYIAKKYLER